MALRFWGSDVSGIGSGGKGLGRLDGGFGASGLETSLKGRYFSHRLEEVAFLEKADQVKHYP